MRFLIAGGAPHAGPPEAGGGHTWHPAWHLRGYFNAGRGAGEAEVDMRRVDALVDEVASYDGVFCESTMALILAQEWRARGPSAAGDPLCSRFIPWNRSRPSGAGTAVGPWHRSVDRHDGGALDLVAGAHAPATRPPFARGGVRGREPAPAPHQRFDDLAALTRRGGPLRRQRPDVVRDLRIAARCGRLRWQRASRLGRDHANRDRARRAAVPHRWLRSSLPRAPAHPHGPALARQPLARRVGAHRRVHRDRSIRRASWLFLFWRAKAMAVTRRWPSPIASASPSCAARPLRWSTTTSPGSPARRRDPEIAPAPRAAIRRVWSDEARFASASGERGRGSSASSTLFFHDDLRAAVDRARGHLPA